MGDYKQLRIWKRSSSLVEEIYKLTREFPRKEKYNLEDQMNRASVSVPSNIAEGYSRNSIAQTLFFINVSYGSLCELENQVIISRNLGYIPEPKSAPILQEMLELKKMIFAYQKFLKNL